MPTFHYSLDDPGIMPNINLCITISNYKIDNKILILIGNNIMFTLLQ